jgi:hypothetical protein
MKSGTELIQFLNEVAPSFQKNIEFRSILSGREGSSEDSPWVFKIDGVNRGVSFKKTLDLRKLPHSGSVFSMVLPRVMNVISDFTESVELAIQIYGSLKDFSWNDETERVLSHLNLPELKESLKEVLKIKELFIKAGVEYIPGNPAQSFGLLASGLKEDPEALIDFCENLYSSSSKEKIVELGFSALTLWIENHPTTFFGMLERNSKAS